MVNIYEPQMCKKCTLYSHVWAELIYLDGLWSQVKWRLECFLHCISTKFYIGEIYL